MLLTPPIPRVLGAAGFTLSAFGGEFVWTLLMGAIAADPPGARSLAPGLVLGDNDRSRSDRLRIFLRQFFQRSQRTPEFTGSAVLFEFGDDLDEIHIYLTRK
jgi:hypothetical protein